MEKIQWKYSTKVKSLNRTIKISNFTSIFLIFFSTKWRFFGWWCSNVYASLPQGILCKLLSKELRLIYCFVFQATHQAILKESFKKNFEFLQKCLFYDEKRFDKGSCFNILLTLFDGFFLLLIKTVDFLNWEIPTAYT